MTVATTPAATAAAPAAAESPPPATRRWLCMLGLALVLLAATAIRAHYATWDSLWYDEVTSIENALFRPMEHDLLHSGTFVADPPRLLAPDHPGAFADYLAGQRREVHPPLYFLLLRLWTELFGTSPLAVRSLTVLFSLLAIVLTYDVARLLFNRSTALWAAALMATMPYAIFFSVEARPYMLSCALWLAAAALVLRIIRDGSTARRTILLAIVLCAAMLTHYFAVAPLAAIASYGLLRKRARPVLTATAAATAVYLLTWGSMAYHQMVLRHQTHEWARDYPTVAVTLTRAANVVEGIIGIDGIAAGANGFAGAAFILLPFLFVRRNPALLLPAGLLVACIGLPVIMDLTEGTGYTQRIRYSATAIPAVALVVAGIAATATRRWQQQVFPAVVLLAGPLAWPGMPAAEIGPREPHRDIAAYLNRHAEPGDLLLTDGRGTTYRDKDVWFALSYYLHHHMPLALVDAGLSADALQRLRSSGGWFVRADRLASTDWLPPDIRITGYRRFNQMALLRLDPAPPPSQGDSPDMP